MKSKLLLTAFLFSLTAQADVELPRFKKISGEVYRSGRPNKEALEWLQDNYNMKTIINLENSNFYVEREQNWAEDLGINYYSIPMSASSRPEDAKVNEALRLMTDTSLHPIVIHCKHGRDRTGMIVGLHRVESENWDAQVAYDEMLDLGFRPFFWNLDNYYKDRTGLDKVIGQLSALLQ